ncbi:MAG TPA: SMC-Scp complex subunit ScpB [Actinocrinis sp.]|nr:SMC-Scp complex subunit ScpB [Actinocrinis sp.]
MTDPFANPGGGAAFWAARGVRIEPEPERGDDVLEDERPDEDADTDVSEASEADKRTRVEAVAETGFDVAELDDAPADEADEADASPGGEFEAVVGIPAQANTDERAVDHHGVDRHGGDQRDVDEHEVDQHEVDQNSVDEHDVEGPGVDDPGPRAEIAFIPAQSSLEDVEPQDGDVVDGLVALTESMAETRRTRSLGPEPAWQLSAGDLAAPLPPLKTCLEAVLMVVDEPVTAVVLAQVVERPKSEVDEALRELAEEYTATGRGFELREVGTGEGDGTGWRMYSRPECAPVVERFVRDGQQAKLTQAALETLAVVAYRQPVSRSKVSAIRGVNCDGVMRTLLARGLVEECGTEHETGALLYRTTGYFLERMGLKGLDELPDLAPLLPSAADLEDEA